MSSQDSYTIPDIARSALLTIDVQQDFTEPEGAAPIPNTRACVPAMVRLLRAYRMAKLPIVHVIRLYLPDGSNVDLSRRTLIESGRRIVAPNSPGAALASDFTDHKWYEMDTPALLAGKLQEIAEREWLMYKPRWDGFYGTSLERHLRELSVSSVTIVGCNFPNCPRATAYGASMRDFRVTLVRDAVSGAYERGLAELNSIGIETPFSDEFLLQFASLPIVDQTEMRVSSIDWQP